MRGTRAYVRVRLPPLICATLAFFLLHAVTAKGWHFSIGSRMQQVCTLQHVAGDDQELSRPTAYFYAPPGAILSTMQVSIRVDSCHAPSTSASAREVGRLRTNPETYTWKQFTSHINISDLSLVRCFVPKSEEFVSVGIFSTVSFPLRTAS